MSPVTIGGVLRQRIVDAGVVNARAWADNAPGGATFPYVTIIDSIATNPDLQGDAATIRLVRVCQVDLWQRPDTESYTLIRDLYGLLDGWRPVINGAATTRCKVTDVQRFFEGDTNIVHHALTLTVKHDPPAL